MTKTLWFGAALLAATAALGEADEKKADDKKPDKVKLPVAAKLVAKDAKYKLDLGTWTADEFERLVKAKEKQRFGILPPAPAVDLVLEITNTSDKDVQIFVKADLAKVTLKLEGPGVVNATNPGPFQTDRRLPPPVKLAPGKTHSIPIKSLQHGHRNETLYTYWTKPGEYKLTADFATGVNPAPEGTQAGPDGFAEVTVTSEPVKITVEK